LWANVIVQSNACGVTTMSDEVAICDAIADDLNQLALPEHGTLKYIEPRALRGDQGKWLVVFTEGIDPELLVTPSEYEDRHRITVVWAVPIFDNAEYNLPADSIVTAALADARLIGQRLKSYGCEVPGLAGHSAVLVKVRYDSGEQGFLWQAIFELSVEAFT